MTRQPLRGAGVKEPIVFWFYWAAVDAAGCGFVGTGVGGGGGFDACFLWAQASLNNYRIKLKMPQMRSLMKVS